MAVKLLDHLCREADNHLKLASRKDAKTLIGKVQTKCLINSGEKIVVTSDRNSRRAVNPIQHLLLEKPLGVFAASWHAVVWTEDAACDDFPHRHPWHDNTVAAHLAILFQGRLFPFSGSCRIATNNYQK